MTLTGDFTVTDGVIVGLAILLVIWIVVAVVGFIVIKIGDLLGKDW